MKKKLILAIIFFIAIFIVVEDTKSERHNTKAQELARETLHHSIAPFID